MAGEVTDQLMDIVTITVSVAVLIPLVIGWGEVVVRLVALALRRFL